MNTVISLKNISKTYSQGNVQALKNVSLEIEKGDFVAIMGHSGSGKSTLMNLLGCLDKPTTGTYALDDVETTSLKSKELSKIRNSKIGFVFQAFNLISTDTALENVERPLMYASEEGEKLNHKQRTQKAEEMLEKMGLLERKNHLPSELSGGQQQRVAIARAMINNPSFILADEPTGNLDSNMAMEILSLFQKLNQEGKTVVMVTHEKEFADYCKRIITLKDGVVVSDFRNENQKMAEVTK